ncbi:MAG: glucose-6-phosphate isomerase, partial [Sulfitobacter sp.]
MTNLPYAVWPELVQHAENLKTKQLKALFLTNPDRANRYSIETAGIYLDYSKNFFDDKTESLLIKLASESGVFSLAQQMFEGVALNNSEQRPALHTLLRAKSAPPGLEDSFAQVSQSLARVKGISDAVRNGQWRGFSGKTIKQVLHLGIGGSYLGPKMVDEALASSRPKPEDDFVCHYVANVDAHHLDEVLSQLDPAETLIIVVSKSFNTLETMANAHSTRLWLLNAMPQADLNSHLVAVSSNIPAATDFGISVDNILPMWDWVGGRYSVWSAVGIPIAIRYGFDVFQQLLDGASEMDQHFLHAEPQYNMPFVMAFLSVFYQHCFGSETHAVLTYDHRLRYLPDHLQQVDMESNGKSRDIDGNALPYHSGAVIWGGEGTNGQHAFHQLLHQGTRTTGVDFIMTLRPDHQHQD